MLEPILWIAILSTFCEIAPKVNAKEPCQLFVNIGPGNDLVLPGSKLLPVPKLAQTSIAIWNNMAIMN